MRWLPALRIASALLFVATIALGITTMRTMNSTRTWTSKASNALMSSSLADRALQLDLLNARAGLLRNYDPLNADLAAERDSFADLGGLNLDPRARAMLDALVARTRKREELVERFKSGNALLQNSLTRFTANGTAEVGSRNALSARILKLTLDTSPQAVADARAALARMPLAAEGTPAAQLVSHARLLTEVLPQIDALLHAIRAMRVERGVDDLTAVLREDSRERAMKVRRLQVLLAVTSVLLVLCVVLTVIAQRLRTREFKAQAANERLSAAIAIPLIDTGKGDFGARVQEAVHRLALHIGARRLQLLIPGVTGTASYSWPDVSLPEQWLSRFVDAADAAALWRDDKVIASRNGGDLAQSLDAAMRGADINDLVMLRTVEPLRVVVGFEPDGSALAQRRDHMAGLSSAIVAIAHGARREVMQAERERLDRTLARARRMETIGAMASGVAHNFNNIIGAIRGFAEMGQERTRYGSQARYTFDEIQTAVQRAHDLVDDILNFAKQGCSAKQPLDVGGIIGQTVRLLAASVRDKCVFLFEPPKTPCVVLGSSSRLQQVFHNICSNAAHASDYDLVQVTASQCRLETERVLSHGLLDAGDYVVVSISDSGPGIAAASRPRLFEPFYSTKRGGTGLGLSTAWEAVQDHGGTIDVTDVPTGGACFDIWLPSLDYRSALQSLEKGSRILLLSGADRLSSDEESLAEMGFEPVGLPLPANSDLVKTTSADCDAILIAHDDATLVEHQAREIFDVLQGQPLLLAVGPSQALWGSGSYINLHYPLREQISNYLHK
jgi:signal transduction histidine kinase